MNKHLTIPVIATLLMSGAVAASPIASAADCTQRTITAADVPSWHNSCSLTGWTVLFPTDLTLVVPDPGTAVTASILDSSYGSDGVAYQSADGNLAAAVDEQILFATSVAAEQELQAILDAGQDTSDPTASSLRGPEESSSMLAANPKCSLTATYNYNMYWYAKLYKWSYNSSGQSSTSALSRIGAAANTVANGSSVTCGTRSNALNTSYLGTTSSRGGVTTSGCGASDLKNVVDWGDLNEANSWLGVTCRWTNISSAHELVLVEADIRFDNSNRGWYTGSDGSACISGRYDLQSVATHEMLHAVGLEHVSNATQVMGTDTGPCRVDWRQLGRGDQDGLRVIYGY